MKFSTAFAAVAALVPAANAAKESRTFAVMRFNGKELVTGRIDPIVMEDQQTPSAHVHTVMGASNFGFSVSGPQLLQSQCTNAKIHGDMSNYWYPTLFFHDAAANTFEKVEMFYTNVYYFFDRTHDEIKAFPLGLRMVAGNASTRVAPALKGDTKLTSPGAQPASWTCPRPNLDSQPPSWPLDSDGSRAGFQSRNNKGEGTGFPFANCDGYASPLRADVHFPSCYNPAAGIKAYKTNSAYPTDNNGYLDCPPGWIHVPHLFLEVYWNTPKFLSRWTPMQGSQPFVLSNGDRTGFSSHADFISGWDEATLQHIIDTCDAGTAGMDKCPGVQTYPDNTVCKIDSPVNEVIDGVLTKLPGNNPLAGWGVGNVNIPPSGPANPNPNPAPVDPPATSTPLPAPTGGAQPPKNKEEDDTTVPPPATTPPPNPQETIPSVTSKVVTTTDSNGRPATVTVWETVTAWVTKTVYEDGSPVPAPTGGASSVKQVGGWTALGCYKDNSDRVIKGDKYPKLGPLTNELCVAHCQGKGFKVAGTENGGQCFCGNAVVGSEKIADATCSTPCEGDAAQSCGGAWALSVFSADGTIGSAAKRHLHAHARAHAHAYSPRRRR